MNQRLLAVALIALTARSVRAQNSPAAGLAPPVFRVVSETPENATVPDTGESAGGFPSWGERVIHEWINRARSDPQYEMTICGAPCAEGACYTPQPPLTCLQALNHSSRFHSAEMDVRNFFDHWSECTLVSNLNSIYPAACGGAAACACVAGTVCGTFGCGTDPFTRISLFGTSGSGEIIAFGYPTPDAAFYAWLYEPASTSACGYTPQNGHRYLILTSSGSVGAGIAADYYTGDFGPGPAPTQLPSGSHFPQQAVSVDAWANWYDTAAPLQTKINVDGVCQAMTLTHGTATNGAYQATVTGVGTGCHRYYFAFKDSLGNEVDYPTTGSFGIGPSGACADWDPSKPFACGSPGPDIKFYTLAPCRLIDTRNAGGTYGGPALQGNGAGRNFPVDGHCGVDPGAIAVAANITVINPSAGGDLRLYPAGFPSNSSAINFRAGRTIANNVFVPVVSVPLGTMTVQCDIANGTTQFLFDVTGYFK